MTLTKDLAALFSRDLSRLIQQVEAFPDDKALWQTLPGIPNSAGNLALHLEGNLREYVGRQLGNYPYVRKRDLEFSSEGFSKAELVARLTELKQSIPPIIAELSSDQLDREYPEKVLAKPTSTQEFLIHLYGHLNWHLGQVHYLRSILAAA